MNVGELDRLYLQYGFKLRKASDPRIRVYTYRQGYFNNAEIVKLASDIDVSKDMKGYETSGYSCSVKSYTSIGEAREKLFSGFFHVGLTRDRFYQEAESFVEKQSLVLGVNYKYVNPPYSSGPEGVSLHKTKPLVDEIISHLCSKGPRLIILEAAAGYGKTCTSYEVLSRSLDAMPEKVPLFMELSRNRQAKIFRYVLLDEKERVFPGLSYDLVQSEIQNGNVCLIIDGFDELLHRAESMSDEFDEVEPMLETISDLLSGEAKVVLTTRRTAIFSGDHFHCWMDRHENQFSVSRYSLQKPSIEDWLNEPRLEEISKKGFPIQHLSNPVLLAFLSGQSDEKFSELCASPEKIVDEYFNRLLVREQERQSLRMEPQEQYEVFVNLARSLVKQDISSDDHEYIQLQIFDGNYRLLNKVRNRYPSEEKPSVEDLSAKFVTHALMDRKSDEEDKVGFINDFVFGNFIGESIIQSHDEEVYLEIYYDKAALAYACKAPELRCKLLEKLRPSLQCSDAEDRILAEANLMGGQSSDLIGSTINGLEFFGAIFGDGFAVRDTVFSGCSFSEVSFFPASFFNVTFVGCRFFGCSVVGGVNENVKVFFTGCEGAENLQVGFGVLGSEDVVGRVEEADVFVLSVLSQFWPKGRPNFSQKRRVATLYKGHNNEDRYLVSRAIDELRGSDLIYIHGDTAELNVSRIAEIRSMLGRVDS